jgi:hypothetical protein
MRVRLFVAVSLAAAFVGCAAKPTMSVGPDADPCTGLGEQSCSSQSGCYALYTASNEAGQVGGEFVSCVGGSATCTLGSGCGFGGEGCQQGMTIAFSIASPGDCDTGVSVLGCVHVESCSP